MRKIAYIVEDANKIFFKTENYDVATGGGNRIEKIVLTTVDEISPKEKEKAAIHARKIQNILRKRRA